jgi:hypothetical protein
MRLSIETRRCGTSDNRIPEGRDGRGWKKRPSSNDSTHERRRCEEKVTVIIYWKKKEITSMDKRKNREKNLEQ